MKINHDMHIHTGLSLCADKTVKVCDYVSLAKENGLRKIAITNHFWDEKIQLLPTFTDDFYRVQNFEHISKAMAEIEECKNQGVEIIFGCEADYDYTHRSVGILPETAEKLEYIIVSNSHTHMTMPKSFYMPYEKHIEFMKDAFNDIISCDVSRYIKAVAHPFEAVCCPYDMEMLIDMISDDEFKFMFNALANKGIAFEINTCQQKGKTDEEISNSAQIRMFRLAKECGCKFVFGSDSHKKNDHDFIKIAEFISELIELKENDISDFVK